MLGDGSVPFCCSSMQIDFVRRCCFLRTVVRSQLASYSVLLRTPFRSVRHLFRTPFCFVQPNEGSLSNNSTTEIRYICLFESGVPKQKVYKVLSSGVLKEGTTPHKL